jgi:hypothetical protein
MEVGELVAATDVEEVAGPQPAVTQTPSTTVIPTKEWFIGEGSFCLVL